MIGLALLSIVAVLTPICLSEEVFYQLPTPYSYSCLNETCSRDKTPEDSPSTMSLAKCRLLCGEHRSIWPRPNGVVDVANDLVSFKPQRLVHCSHNELAEKIVNVKIVYQILKL